MPAVFDHLHHRVVLPGPGNDLLEVLHDRENHLVPVCVSADERVPDRVAGVLMNVPGIEDVRPVSGAMHSACVCLRTEMVRTPSQ